MLYTLFPQILKSIKIFLRRKPSILHSVICFLRPDIKDQADGKKVKVADGNSDFYAAQKKKRGGHFPLTSARPFFAWISVTRLLPQSSKISGRTW